jgi:hypothetical protein
MLLSAPPVTRPVYDHLLRLTDGIGIFEHALGGTPRPEHGYCVDDVARALVLTVREPSQTLELAGATAVYLRFLIDATASDGRIRNRRRADGRWAEAPGLGDWWGRAIWATGIAAAMATMADDRHRALDCLLVLTRQRCRHVRSRAFAMIGAAEFLRVAPHHPVLLEVVRDGMTGFPTEPVGGWRWVEPRLRYANGALAEAVIAGGMALDDIRTVRRGVDMLEALVDLETRGHRLSVVPVGGRGPGESGPRFDQQPIEVAALADAARRAFDATGDHRWLDVVRRCWAWFLGENDADTPMVDLETGAGFDGLERFGRNANRGAESTIAALATWQDAVMADRIDART